MLCIAELEAKIVFNGKNGLNFTLYNLYKNR